MKKQSLILLLTLVLLSACGGGKSESDPAVLQLTALPLAATMIAETNAAMPPTITNTPLPPTETATLTPYPTLPSTSTPFVPPTETATNPPPDTATPFKAPNKKAPLKLTNNTKSEIRFILQNPGYQEYKFTKTMFIQVLYGSYDYVAWIGTEGPFTGSIFLNNQDKWELVFDKNGVTFFPP